MASYVTGPNGTIDKGTKNTDNGKINKALASF
jgi:hypothetical protein